MLWTEIDFSKIRVGNNGKTITYGNEYDKFRFQIPRGYCEFGINEFDSISISMLPVEFLTWFKTLETHLIAHEFDSKVSSDDVLYMKYYTDFTQIFDTNNRFMFDENVTMENSDIDCIIEVSSLYGPYKGKYGLVCKLYQVRVSPCGSLFSVE